MKVRALFGTVTIALTVALASPLAAQDQQPPPAPQSSEQQQDPAARPQQDEQRQGTTADPGTTGTSGQLGNEQPNNQNELPATASPLPLMALAGFASLAGAWAVRRVRRERVY